ncbi:restriction alleviation protein, Lar family [Pseudomonas aeruginosa]|uniref:Lar family restriction alleviation protein n=1 Tax=Pseudomonas aeruginosa TaxID=287 RepID=UPI000FD57E16|nr:Lar family restriction alleviation protein [Pseudomonas aeruginosa]MBG6882061.1 restriction alleviation protein, Lar family [Pseudomonas aeruginosa]MBG7467864.1 restriction alleviation protein, Lar family [Pseudomonas aeruginosa]MBI8222286.1 Lar family restriction alleviation protein [Pseudomonas aeruginosa]MDP5708297.1 Lar family restriction alleviation protein [Pseudomonas aeruginosa]RUF99407.1 restriction alleviation protein, Lar family [Pseudomonas aeruginosa]
MSELKSCPMCGGAAFVGPLTRKRWFCECEECGVSMISQNDKQHAIDQWNRRSIPADQVLVPRELLERLYSSDTATALMAAAELRSLLSEQE